MSKMRIDKRIIGN